jgi:hypothetical protein
VRRIVLYFNAAALSYGSFCISWPFGEGIEMSAILKHNLYPKLSHWVKF